MVNGFRNLQELFFFARAFDDKKRQRKAEERKTREQKYAATKIACNAGAIIVM